MYISMWTQPLSLNSFFSFVCFLARICLFCWNMLLFKCVWVWVLSVWTCALNSSRLSREKANVNENECNMWIQVSHWSIRTTEPIQHLNLPPPLLTRPHQCQLLLSYLLSSTSLFTRSVDPHSHSPIRWVSTEKKTTALLWTSCQGPSSKWKLLNIMSQVFII